MKKQTTILTVSNSPDRLDQLGLYTIMLAKRTGMIACLLFVLPKGKSESCNTPEEEKKIIQERILNIQDVGAKAQVRIDCLITAGHFVEEVAKYIQIFDSPILIVDEGECRLLREKELRRVEKILKSRTEISGGRTHHFLVISGKDQPGVPIAETSFIDSVSMNQGTVESAGGAP